MSDSQAQPQAQQAAGGQPSQMMRPDDILRLQCLTEDERQKYRQVMMNFWNMTQQHAAGTSEHTTARQKLFEYSQKFIARERQHRKMKMQQQQGSQGQSSQGNPGAQQSQGVVKQEQPQGLQRPAEGVAAPQQQPQGQQSAPAQQQAQQQPQGPGPTRPAAPVTKNSQIDSAIIQHVSNFPIQLPLSGPAPGTPEYNAKVKEYRSGYLNMLAKQAQFADNRRKLMLQINEQQQKGLEVSADLLNMRQRVEKEHAQLGEQVDKFRKAQKQWKEERERKQAQDGQGQLTQQEQPQIPTPSPQQQQPMQQQSQPPQQPQRQPSIPNMPTQGQVKEEPQIKVEGGQIPPPQPAAQFNMQGNPGAQQAPQGLQMPPSLQQQQQQQQQQQARPPPAPHSQTMPPNQGQQFAQPGQPQQHQQQQHMQQNRPQINPHQANAHQHQQSNSPHPQSATSNAPGAPVPLSHQAAVSAANRSYTDPQRTNTPLQQGQGNFGNREREQLNNPKMPIPRHLNVASPAPVHMGQARPTMSGPTNGAPGPMGQPVIPRPPPFQLEGEGDRVLSKRKLDELVRQVTGGSEEALTSEVEEVRQSLTALLYHMLTLSQAVLQLADDFVDNVISSACKLSKLRESPQLDIRDLQLILERNYNIRIPGYASDEVRTVRKIVPAAGWVDKMKAVNAAKVMGGKADF
jgi:transcription initiation factor TFIID subunit 12